jgi:hypothetical protein
VHETRQQQPAERRQNVNGDDYPPKHWQNHPSRVAGIGNSFTYAMT